MVAVNYALNAFMPFVVVAVLSFNAMGWERIEPYAIFGLMFFASRYNWKVGYSVAYCESMGVDFDDPRPIEDQLSDANKGDLDQ